MVPTDDVKMEYHVLTDPDSVGIKEAFSTQAPVIEKVVRRPLEQYQTADGKAPSGDDAGMIMQEEQEVQNATFLLRLLKL